MKKVLLSLVVSLGLVIAVNESLNAGDIRLKNGYVKDFSNYYLDISTHICFKTQPDIKSRMDRDFKSGILSITSIVETQAGYFIEAKVKQNGQIQNIMLANTFGACAFLRDSLTGVISVEGDESGKYKGLKDPELK